MPFAEIDHSGLDYLNLFPGKFSDVVCESPGRVPCFERLLIVEIVPVHRVENYIDHIFALPSLMSHKIVEGMNRSPRGFLIASMNAHFSALLLNTKVT